MGSLGIQDNATISASEHKLITVRLIAMVSAVILAKSKGNKLCENNSRPAPTELDNFFRNYVSPNSPFGLFVDPKGGLHVGPKSVGKTSGGISTDGGKTLTPPVIGPKGLFDPVNKVFKCKFNASKEDINKVNEWMAQLDKEVE